MIIWSMLCSGDVRHIVKESSIEEKGRRKSGFTYCNKETNSNVDRWAIRKYKTNVCGVCWRAYQKKRGISFSRASRTYRDAVLDIRKIPPGHRLGRGEKNARESE